MQAAPEPTDHLLQNVAWSLVDEEVRRQQRNREVYSPGISLFRWWARRPHGLIGALLDAARVDGDDVVVSDPFSGGGTVAMEAARRGMAVYAQDLHPWAMVGLATTLDGIDPEALEAGGQSLTQRLGSLRTELYGTTCPGHDGPCEVLHTFWVRDARCPGCAQAVYLFPFSLLTLDSRNKNEARAWFGCRACGHVTRSTRHADRHRCGQCRRPLEPADAPLLREGEARCPRSGCERRFRPFEGVASWTPALVQRLCHVGASRPVLRFDRPSEAERVQAAAQRPTIPDQLLASIPDGMETRRLRRAGLQVWADLYPPRQLHVLLKASELLASRSFEPSVAARLRLVVAGAAEMAGFASRWDRYYPKAFEATANHRFNLTGFSCETNLLADRGRGTLPRRIQHSVRAARWAQGFPTAASGRIRSATGGRDRRPSFGEAHLVRGSSSRQLLADGVADLVLTDPPYFDDVQYAELASLFLAWAQLTGLVASNVHVNLSSEAVVNSSREAGVESYRTLLTRILRETRRTLRVDGRMVLTFHNSDGRAWWALGRALADAGFGVAALAVAHAENETDHAKRKRRSFSCDLVIECRPNVTGEKPLIITPNTQGEAAELVAAGMAVSEITSRNVLARSYAAFSDRYRSLLGNESSKLIVMAKPKEHLPA